MKKNRKNNINVEGSGEMKRQGEGGERLEKCKY